ncbi:hypothetical protein K438DRAFT_1852152 [Mycena galopus ATCC 62051]|nr:hypothetical protein K438DRAFT_1852152 [Mycena galopus ATCC 62051]
MAVAGSSAWIRLNPRHSKPQLSEPPTSRRDRHGDSHTSCTGSRNPTPLPPPEMRPITKGHRPSANSAAPSS